MSDEEKAMKDDWDGGEEADATPSFDGGADEEGGTRILNQEEIDSLLGFDDDTVGAGETSGVMALINSAMVNYERLPMLDIVFILLIFFIVTATFLSEEGIDMRPPPDNDSETPPDAAPPIVIQVDDDNEIFVNQVRTDVDRVLSAVNRFRAEEPNSAVLLEVYDEAEHGIIVQIWDEMGANGVPVSIQRANPESRD